MELLVLFILRFVAALFVILIYVYLFELFPSQVSMLSFSFFSLDIKVDKKVSLGRKKNWMTDEADEADEGGVARIPKSWRVCWQCLKAQ